MTYRLSIAAENDILEIFRIGAEQFGLAQDERYHDSLEKTFALIAAHPRAAAVRQELMPEIRVHPCGSHVVLYRVECADKVFIIRVRHAHEDWLT